MYVKSKTSVKEMIAIRSSILKLIFYLSLVLTVIYIPINAQTIGSANTWIVKDPEMNKDFIVIIR